MHEVTGLLKRKREQQKKTRSFNKIEKISSLLESYQVKREGHNK